MEFTYPLPLELNRLVKHEHIISIFPQQCYILMSKELNFKELIMQLRAS